VQQPKKLDNKTGAEFIHITYNSDIFGFLDDVYLNTSVYQGTFT